MVSEDKPLVSFMVFSYKQEQFIQDAIKSAFEQTYEPLEIIFSDDCSPDQTFDIIKEEVKSYQGPHKIVLNRNEHNLGLAGNINRAFGMAQGLFFVMAAGDDISVPERTAEMVTRWLDKESPVDLVCSYFEEIDVNGKPTGFVKKTVVFVPDIASPVQQWTCGATGACAGYNRKLYDKYGPLDTRIIAEDWVFSFRAWAESGIGLIEKPLVKHRTHDKCLSVIFKNVKSEQSIQSRKLLRQRSTGNKVARVKDWLRTWQIAGKNEGGRTEAELEEWVQLLELEWKVYDSGRLQAFKTAIQSLGYRGGIRTAMRLIFRHVLRMY